MTDKITHCVICNVALTEVDIAEEFETCIECDLNNDMSVDDVDDDKQEETVN